MAKAESYVVTISVNDGRVLIGRIVGYFNMIVDSIISSHNAAFIELMALDDDKYHSYIKKEAIIGFDIETEANYREQNKEISKQFGFPTEVN